MNFCCFSYFYVQISKQMKNVQTSSFKEKNPVQQGTHWRKPALYPVFRPNFKQSPKISYGKVVLQAGTQTPPFHSTQLIVEFCSAVFQASYPLCL